MNRLIVFLLGIFFSQLLFSQHSQLEADISSLEKILRVQRNYSESDLMNLNRLSFLYIKHGNLDKADSINKLVAKSLFPVFSVANPVAYRALDIRGQIYFALNDIAEAQRIWTLSLSLKQCFFPQKKGWIAESYSNIARCYNYLIEIDSALFYAEKAVELLNQCSDLEWCTVNAPEILRTYIYAYKIGMRDKNMLFYSERTIEKFDSVIEIHHPLMYCYLPDFMHDKANVYTDLALYFRNEISNKNKNPALSEYYYHQAIRFYREEKVLRECYNINPVHFSTMYFTMTLVNTFTYGNTVSNNLRCLALADSSIAVLKENQAGGDLSKLYYKSWKLDVMKFKGIFLHSLYEETKNTIYLFEMYENSKEAYATFIFLANELKSKNFGSVFQVYNLFQFDALIYSELELYKLTGDKDYLNSAFNHSQQSRFLDLLSELKNKARLNFNEEYFYDIVRKNILYTLYSNHVFLDYYSSDYNSLVIFVISNGKLNYYTGDRPDFSKLAVLSDPGYLNSKSDTVYRILNSLYNDLIKPVEGYIKGKRNIHISSKSEFSAVPFDALVADLSNPNHFLGDDYCIQNRFSLLINPLYKSTNQNDPVSLFTLNPQYITHPDLLYAEFKLQMQLFCFSKLIIISDVESNIRNAFWDGDLVCIESRICLHQ